MTVSEHIEFQQLTLLVVVIILKPNGLSFLLTGLNSHGTSVPIRMPSKAMFSFCPSQADHVLVQVSTICLSLHKI